jgi:hypothetical protein
MADRKKQPTRGSRKRSPTRKKAEPLTIEPLEVHLQLVGIQRNAKGEVVGKAVMLEGTLLPPDFPTIPKQLKDAAKQHQEAAAQTEDG